MKLNTFRRGSAAAAVLALSFGLAACGSDDTDSSASDAPAATSESSDAAPSESDSPAASTVADQTFGEGCAAVPTDPTDPGSFDGMVQDTVGTAASNNPILQTLVTAVTSVDGLVDVLNDPAGTYTVFAPYDPAFEAIPAEDLQGLLDGAGTDGLESPLAQILTHHVLGENLDPAAVVGEQDTVNGDTVTIEGDESGMTVSDGTVTANVLCGNIPTANATVYVIDQVLTGATVK